MDELHDLRKLLDLLAFPVFGIGLLLIIYRNVEQWKQDVLRKAQVQRQESERALPSDLPLVSVLVAAWNEELLLEGYVHSFQALRYPHKQLILVAGGRDKTSEIARALAVEDSRIIVVDQKPGQGKQRALRQGLEFATGELIFLTDADCTMNDEAFEKTLLPLIAKQAVASTGAYQPLEAQMTDSFVRFQWAVDHYAFLYAGEQSAGMLGANCAVSRAVLVASGGFNTDAVTGTDYTLARQLIAHGYTIRNVPTSFVRTEYPTSLVNYYHLRLRWLRNLIVLGWKYRDFETAKRGLLSGFLAVIMLVMPFTAIVFGPFMLALWGLLAVQALAARVRYILLIPTQSRIERLHLIAVGGLTFGVDMLTWASALIQAIVPSLRTQWR